MASATRWHLNFIRKVIRSRPGLGIERLIRSLGYHVLATARKTNSIADLASKGITTLALEVDKPESIAALKEKVAKITNGKLDYLVNNAGRNYTVPATEYDFDEVELTFQTNVFGVMRMCKAFTPLLIAAKGTIVQLGSLAGLMPYVFGSAYNASKAALHAYSNTLRVEMAPFEVRVVIIVTGGVLSQIARINRVLAPDSLYLPIKDDYERRTKHSQEVGMPAEKYAKQVVTKLTVKNPPRSIWAGYGVNLVWFATTFLPQSLLVRLYQLAFVCTDG